MNGRDPHQSLKSEILAQTQSKSVRLLLAKLQWSKSDIGFSLHTNPYTYSTHGFQANDFLKLLGFERSRCSFLSGNECYVKWVDKGFDVTHFARLFDQSFANLLAAQRDLEQCGFFFEQPEGWGYFFGKRSGGSRREWGMRGDGHTAMAVKSMKESEDTTFLYKFSWLESAHEKGWVIHYRPKHPPLSSELQSVFRFLGLQEFKQCPEYDFETCYWNSVVFVKRGDRHFDSNAGAAHGWFDAHAAHFSPGVEKLLRANAEIEEAGFNFLPFAKATARLNEDIERRTVRPTHTLASRDLSTFDVAISFAGTERECAEQLATMLKDAGFSVFYDDFYPEYLWGKNLVDTFDEIFRKRARYCVIFVSKEYKERVWTNHERQSAQARALTEKGKEYILPIKVDETELDGIPPTIGYVDLGKGIKRIGDLLVKKLKS